MGGAGQRLMPVCALWIWQSFQQAVHYGSCLKRLRQRYQLGDLSVEVNETSLLPLYFFSFGFTLLSFLKELVGTILFICISWRHCQRFSWCLHKYAYIQDCQKRKEKKNAMEQIELGMFVFSVLFNAQLFLEVALSLCIPFFPLPSALYGGTYLCVCNVCMCVHVSRVCNK